MNYFCKFPSVNSRSLNPKSTPLFDLFIFSLRSKIHFKKMGVLKKSVNSSLVQVTYLCLLSDDCDVAKARPVVILRLALSSHGTVKIYSCSVIEPLLEFGKAVLVFTPHCSKAYENTL